ncbi:MAG: hypothetical protein IJT75_10325 [Bacteroidaceae bacterium]|nr:hypothetical protein [Bacteroidaceae bacterium]
MKTKTQKWMLMPLLALSLSATFVACGGDDDTTSNTGGGGGEFPPVEKQLTNEEQKERLNSIGKEVINLVPASDFEEILSLGEFIRKQYLDDEDNELTEWLRSCVDAIQSELVDEEQGYYGTYKTVRRTYAAAQFRAHIVWQNGAWRVTEKNTSDLQVACPDRNGQQVVATLNTSSKTKKVYVGETDGDYDDYYQNGRWYYEEEKVLTYIEVPEQINITIKQGSKTIFEATVTTDLSSMSGSYFNLSRDAYGVTVNVSCCGYTFENVRVSAKANSSNGVQASFTIKKDGKALLSASVTGEVDVKGGYVDEDDEVEPEFNGGNVTQLTIDILGELQVKGTCKNIKTFIDTWEKADDYENKTNEMAMRGLASTLNELFTAQLFYGTSTEQATMKLEPFYKEGYWNNNRWELKPLIVFGDGTSYCMTDESYFNEDNFAALTNLFEDLMKSYERLWNKYID